MKRGRFLFWLAAGPLAVLAAMLAAAHPYLAITQRSGGDALVVEGWIEEQDLRDLPRLIDSLRYTRVYTTGSVRPFSYYLKVDEAIEVRFTEAVHGRLSLNVSGVTGAGFRLIAGTDTVMDRFVEGTPAVFTSDREVRTDRLRITSIHSGATSAVENNIFIKYLEVGTTNAHLLQDTTVFVRQDGTVEPAWPTYAHRCAAFLERSGVRVPVVAVPAWGRPDSRSWANASYFGVRAKQDGLAAFDVLTLGVHARRSRELFQRACGPDIRVGVIALEDPACPASGWWRMRSGWVLMLKEIGGSGEPLAVDLTR